VFPNAPNGMPYGGGFGIETNNFNTGYPVFANYQGGFVSTQAFNFESKLRNLSCVLTEKWNEEVRLWRIDNEIEKMQKEELYKFLGSSAAIDPVMNNNTSIWYKISNALPAFGDATSTTGEILSYYEQQGNIRLNYFGKTIKTVGKINDVYDFGTHSYYMLKNPTINNIKPLIEDGINYCNPYVGFYFYKILPWGVNEIKKEAYRGRDFYMY
ncbi:MAG: hypothetical protein H6Q15_2605, partial [Bacteroidetes bacterium]|nr:hypothetical protein [Bacteroidota bacterium]